MLALHESPPHGQFRRQNFPRLKKFNSDGRPYDIDDGIYGTDFMKMNVLNSLGVDFSLGLRQALKDGQTGSLYPCWRGYRQIRPLNDLHRRM